MREEIIFLEEKEKKKKLFEKSFPSFVRVYNQAKTKVKKKEVEKIILNSNIIAYADLSGYIGYEDLEKEGREFVVMNSWWCERAGLGMKIFNFFEKKFLEEKKIICGLVHSVEKKFLLFLKRKNYFLKKIDDKFIFAMKGA